MGRAGKLFPDCSGCFILARALDCSRASCRTANIALEVVIVAPRHEFGFFVSAVGNCVMRAVLVISAANHGSSHCSSATVCATRGSKTRAALHVLRLHSPSPGHYVVARVLGT